MRRLFAVAVLLAFVTTTDLIGQQPSASPPSFRSGVTLVLVDVVVRDRNGAVVKGLNADDFELFEDGARQEILTFAYEEVTPTAAPIANASTLTVGRGRTPAANAAPQQARGCSCRRW